MKDLLRRFHRWQLRTVLGEHIWRFALHRGYESFDAALTSEVRRVGKLKLQLPFDYSLHRSFYGCWDEMTVYIRLTLPFWKRASLFTTASASQFEGKLETTKQGLDLVGSYRPWGLLRWFIMFLIYIPFVLVPYNFIVIIYMDLEFMISGNYEDIAFETVMYILVTLFMFIFWGAGYGIGRFHVAASIRERAEIYKLLERATS